MLDATRFTGNPHTEAPMATWTLYHGNKNYSSWSLRGWLAVKQTGVEFDEELFDLSAPDVRPAIRRHSPSGKVPALKHGDLVLWDSLAIAEYLAEQFPDAGLWPADATARAVARAVSAEMHSSFFDLRREMPMNLRREAPGKGMTPGVQADIDRVTTIWRECRERFGSGGDFLFGPWCIADAFYAPVVGRFRTYGVQLDDTCRAYAAAVWAWPAMAEWCAGARGEMMVIDPYEI
jgi:glutathione S-transferase